MPNFKLSKSKKTWLGNRDTTLNGSPLNYNASQQNKYASQLRDLVLEMNKITKKEILKLFKSKTSKDFFKNQEEIATTDDSIAAQAKKVITKLTQMFDDLFNKRASDIANSMMEGANKTSETVLKSSLKKLSGGLTLKTSVVTKGLEDISKAVVNENVSLIKSIPQKYLTDVAGAVMRSITTGNGLDDLIPQVEKYNAMSLRRAKNLALDQTRKAYNSINKQRMLALGVKKFRWIHSGGGQHPRKSHIAMNGKIYSFDDPPVINQEQVEKGYEAPEKGIPGQAINCKCTMVPVIEFEDGEQA